MSLDLGPTIYCSPAQLKKIHAILREKGINRPTTQADLIHFMSGKPSRTQLSSGEAADLIDRLEKIDRATLHLFIARQDPTK